VTRDGVVRRVESGETREMRGGRVSMPTLPPPRRPAGRSWEITPGATGNERSASQELNWELLDACRSLIQLAGHIIGPDALDICRMTEQVICPAHNCPSQPYV
jgi:hypothetical protein